MLRVAHGLRPRRRDRRALGRDPRRRALSSASPSACTTMLHGEPGDGGPLGRGGARCYRGALPSGARTRWPSWSGRATSCCCTTPRRRRMVARTEAARRHRGLARHIGTDGPNELADEAWRFLLPLRRAGGRLRVLARRVRLAGLDPRRWRDPALDRRLLAEEPADGRRDRGGDAALRRHRGRPCPRPSAASPASTAPRGGWTGAPR